jgi:UDP-N-acetylglucosamine/UDP-N-acetylgalactosamine 4-epimerase
MTYLVTGAAGFIGSHIVEELLALNKKVVGFDNLSNGSIQTISFLKKHIHAKNFTFIEADITCLDSCRRACKNIDFVIHEAALGSVPDSIENPLKYHSNNTTGILNLLTAAKENNVKRFIFASSSAIYGDNTQLPLKESEAPSPKSPYAVTKLTGEYYCNFFNTHAGLETVSLRYFNVFGPRQNPNSQYAAVIPKFISLYKQNKAPKIDGDGLQTRDFIYVKTVAHINIEACENKNIELGKPINVACGETISIVDLSNLIQKEMKSSHTHSFGIERIGDIKHSHADITKLSAFECLKNDQLSFADALRETILFPRY